MAQGRRALVGQSLFEPCAHRFSLGPASPDVAHDGGRQCAAVLRAREAEMNSISRRASLVLGAGAVLCAARAFAQAGADFYRGKTVTLVISSSAGGGYDVMGRTIAKYLGKHIPGNPRVVVTNMPGAGGIVAMNYLYR